MIAGMIVGTYIVYYSVASDYILIILVYFYIFLTRYVMLGVCYPLLSRLSPGYSYYDVCFSSFAGLRGAVSLVLCIVLQKRVDSSDGEDVYMGGHSYPKSHLRHLVFVVSGVVTLTILINGTLARAFYLFLYTKVDEKSAQADEVILHYVRKRIWRRTEEGEMGRYLFEGHQHSLSISIFIFLLLRYYYCCRIFQSYELSESKLTRNLLLIYDTLAHPPCPALHQCCIGCNSRCHTTTEKSFGSCAEASCLIIAQKAV